MENEKIIELLKEWNRNTMACYELFKRDGKERAAKHNLIESITLDSVIKILTDDEYANMMWDIYFGEA